MPLPVITSSPEAPTRSMTNDEFILDADAFVAWWATLPPQINAWSAAVSALAAELGVGDASDTIAALAGLTASNGKVPLFTGVDTATLLTVSTFAQTLLGDTGAAAMRDTLLLGALATKDTVSNADWSGTDLAVANGGTGGSTVAAARSNFGIDSTGNGGLVPPGAVMPFAMSIAPSGWLECDGSSVSRSTYANLFAAIGTTFGSVDGTHFNLPDLRGEFIRGYDDGRGVDTGRTFGSAQTDGLKAHTHSVAGYSQEGDDGPNLAGAGGSQTATATTGSTGGTETRPRNIALMYCVKV